MPVAALPAAGPERRRPFRPVAAALAAALAALLAAVPAAAWQELLVLTTDYTTYGGAALLERDAPWTVRADLQTVGADAVARWHDGLYWVVDRGGSNIQVLDPAADLATVRQFSLGAGRNPQDIAFAADGTAWVSCYDDTLLLHVDPQAGVILGAVSTAPFADADGLPETGWMLRLGDRLFVTCQRLDRNDWWQPADFSQLLVLDLAAGQWVDMDPAAPGLQGIVLAGANPAPPLEPLPDGRIRVVTIGRFGVADGGVEVVDPVAGTTSGLLVTEQQLGGELLDFVTVGEQTVGIVSDAAFHTSLVAFPAAGGGAPVTWAAAADYDYADVAWDGAGQVYLCDRGLGHSGVRVFDAATGAELTPAPVATGRPPFMCVPPLPTGTAAPAAPPSPVTLAPPFPNPANPAVTLRWRAVPGRPLELSVWDARGRLVARRPLPAAGGDGSWRWDGRDAAGRPVPSGVYLLRLRQGTAVASRRVTLVR